MLELVLVVLVVCVVAWVVVSMLGAFAVPEPIRTVVLVVVALLVLTWFLQRVGAGNLLPQL